MKDFRFTPAFDTVLDGQAAASETAQPMVRVRGLHKIYGGRLGEGGRQLARGKSPTELRGEGYVVGLSDVSFDVAEGQIYVVMGLSGSGKSTLVRCLNRLVEPTAGSVVIDGHDVTKLDARALRQLRATTVSMVFQHFGLLPHRRVLENVTIGLEVQGLPRAERERRAIAALELVGLDAWKRFFPRELSGGMQQRVSLARALAADPVLLLLDEPFSGLDPLIRTEMQEELLRLQRRLKKTIVFITHDLDEALLLGDRVAVLHHGELIEEATPRDLVLRPRTAWVKKFVQRANMLNVLTAGDVTAVAGASDLTGATVDPTMPLHDLLSIVHEKGWPATVADENGKVLGRITRESFAEKLAARSVGMTADPTVGEKAPGTSLPSADCTNTARWVGTSQRKRPE
jgi:glycine betaine/proline transport system ATP-binding protein